MKNNKILWVVIGVIVIVAFTQFKKEAIATYPGSCSSNNDALIMEIVTTAPSTYISWLQQICYNVDWVKSSTDFASIDWNKYEVVVVTFLTGSDFNKISKQTFNSKPLLIVDVSYTLPIYLDWSSRQGIISGTRNMLKVIDHEIVNGLTFPYSIINYVYFTKQIYLASSVNCIAYVEGYTDYCVIGKLENGAVLLNGSTKTGKGVYYDGNHIIDEILFKNAIRWLTAGLCTDECTTGQTGCTDSDTKWSCGEANDGDSCKDKVSTDCTSGQTCSNGVCSTACTCGSWGTCSSSCTKTRTCTPTGCTPTDGLGTSQSCTGGSCVQPCTYSSWSTCSSSCTQTRTVISGTGCTATSQSCTGGSCAVCPTFNDFIQSANNWVGCT